MANRIANPIYDSVFMFMIDMEDEILGELEDLDTTIARQKEQLKHQAEELSQKDEQLSAMQEELEQLRKLLSQK